MIKPEVKLYTLCLGILLFLTCARQDTLYNASGQGNYKLDVYATDTTGIPSNTSKDSIESILKTQLSTIPGEPITLFGFIRGDTSKVTPKWNFGDGKDTAGAIVEHVYDSAGVFHAVFCITDKEGFSISDTVTITVIKVNGSAVRGNAKYQGKSAHSGIYVVLVDKVHKGNSAVDSTKSSGSFRIDSLVINSTYDIVFYDSTYHDAFSPCTLHDISINDGVQNVLPAVTLQDNHPPHILGNKPSGVLDIRQPSISANFTDIGSGISPHTFVFTINRRIVPDSIMKIDTAGFSYLPAQRLPDGVYALVASIQDSAGNKDTLSWSFRVDATKLNILTLDTTVRINDTLKLRSLVSNVYSKVVIFKWDFDGNGTWDDSLATADTLMSRSHVYTHDTVYRAIEYVRDDSGMVKLDTVTINVGNLPPVISSIRQDTTISIKDSILFFGAAHDVDGTIKEYAWDFNGDGTFEYTSPTEIKAGFRYDTAKTYKAVLRVTDDDNKKSYDTARITVIQDAPVVTASTPDTLVSIKDTIHLHASATIRSGTIVKWEWDCGNTGKFVTTSKVDTAVIAPATATQAYACAVRVSDSKGNTSTATVTIKVLKDEPATTFFSFDTIVDHGGTVRCSVYVQQQFGTMTVEIDTANSGVFKSLGSFVLSGGKSYTFPIGSTSSWDSVKIRITDDDGNMAVRGFKVDIRPQPLTITSIDSTVNTITVHYNQTQETDFAQYRIYRNSTDTVDTNSELWATITTAGTVSYTTPTPSYDLTPRYYRVYQKDNEGLLSGGSNVLYGNIVKTVPRIMNQLSDMNKTSFLQKLYSDTIHVYNPNALHLTYSNISSISGISFSNSIVLWTPLDTGDFVLSIQISDAFGSFDTIQWPVNVGLKDIWLTIDTLPQAYQYGSQTVALNGQIYWLGAGDANRIMVYNFQNRTWVNKQPMNQGRQGFGAGIINNQIIVAGGANGGIDPLASVEIYDPSTNIWTLKAPLNKAREWFTLAVVDNKAYAIGGYGNSGAQEYSVEEYDPLLDTWTFIDSIPFLGGPYIKSCVEDSAIFIARTTDFYYKSFKTGKSWLKLPSMQTPRYEIGMCSLNGYIYTFGGNIEGSGYSDNAERYDILNNRWENISTMPSGSEEMPTVVLNNRIYVLTCGGVIHKMYVYVP